MLCYKFDNLTIHPSETCESLAPECDTNWNFLGFTFIGMPPAVIFKDLWVSLSICSVECISPTCYLEAGREQ